MFRPLETYQNILNRPERVTTAEINALDTRRKHEKQVILDLEYKAAEDSDEEEKLKAEKQERWYIISSEWLFKWKCFVQNKISRSAEQRLTQEVRVSPNKQIGILPPGPIQNQSLFIEEDRSA